MRYLPEKAEAVKKQYHLDCPVYADYREMLAREKNLDLIHVCTPPYVHASISIDCMNAGHNVLVGKPMAASLDECDKMLEAEQRNGVVLGCIAQNRFRDSIYRLKKTADSGLAGKPCAVHVDSLWWRGHCYYDLWWRGLWEKEGGGPSVCRSERTIPTIL